MSDPYWISPENLIVPTPSPVPRQVDVLIIGAGLTGLAVAGFLAEGGASVVVLEARAGVGMGVSSRQVGHVQCGLGDNALRLEAAIGPKQTGEILSFCNENISMLQALGVLNQCGTLSIAMSPQETKEMPQVVSVLKRQGVGASLWDPKTVNASLQSTGLGPACHIPNAGTVDPTVLLKVLMTRLTAAGGQVVLNSSVDAVHENPNGISVTCRGQPIQSEVVVLAAGAAMASLDAYFLDKVHAVRTQALAIQSRKDRFKYACEAQYGYGFWRQSPAGHVLFGGCRWATPHLEVGETDDTVVVSAIHNKIRDMIQRNFPDLANQKILQSWSGIMAFTCDGLPIIGPVPGRSRVISCAGFNGHQHSLGLRAARIVADGLLHGHIGEMPQLFRPHRFL